MASTVTARSGTISVGAIAIIVPTATATSEEATPSPTAVITVIIVAVAREPVADIAVTGVRNIRAIVHAVAKVAGVAVSIVVSWPRERGIARAIDATASPRPIVPAAVPGPAIPGASTDLGRGITGQS
jgi:hypothetical protein